MIRKNVLTGFVVAGVALVASLSLASTAIDWMTQSTSQLLLQNDGISYIDGSSTVGVGGFLQLIYLGVDGVYDWAGNEDDIVGQGATATGLKVGGDDQIVAFAHVGAGTKAPGVSGRFTVSDSAHALPDGSLFAIRFFEEASPDYAQGYIPTTVMSYYGIVFGGTPNPFAATSDPKDQFIISGSQTAGYTVAVPEPTTLALGLFGLLGLAYRRFRKVD